MRQAFDTNIYSSLYDLIYQRGSAGMPKIEIIRFLHASSRSAEPYLATMERAGYRLSDDHGVVFAAGREG